MEASVKSVLKQSGQIITHQRELEEIRGEKFNVFSILSMETKEDATHSAFIGELFESLEIKSISYYCAINLHQISFRSESLKK